SLLALPGELKLKESDHKALSKLVGTYFSALNDEKGIMESLQKVLDQIAATDKRLKGTKILSSVGDWEQVFRITTEDHLEETLKKKGEVTPAKLKSDAIEVNVAYCVPKKPVKGAMPLIVSVCDAGQLPSDNLNTYWADPIVRDAA